MTYAENGKWDVPLYNGIDLLIVDESGQVAPELAVPSFSLAKQAILVGDIQQIEPVWSISCLLYTSPINVNALRPQRSTTNIARIVNMTLIGSFGLAVIYTFMGAAYYFHITGVVLLIIVVRCV